MKVCTYFLLIGIFAYTNSSSLHLHKEDKLEIIFNNVSNEQKIGGNHNISRRDFRPPTVKTFMDFIHEVIKILNTYDDETFETFINILDEEIRKYQYKGFKIHKLTAEYDIRNMIADKFESKTGKSIKVAAEVLKHNPNVKPQLNHINFVSRKDAEDNFHNILADLKAYSNTIQRKSKSDLVETVKNFFRAIVSSHYTDLYAKPNRESKNEISVLLKRLRKISPQISKKNSIFRTPAVSKLNSNIFIHENVSTKVNKSILEKNDTTSTTVQTKEKQRRFLRVKRSNERSEDEKSMPTTSSEESNSQELVLQFSSVDEASDVSINGNRNSQAVSTEESVDTNQVSSRELPQGQRRNVAQTYESLYIEDFYKTTEKQKIVHKSDMESQHHSTMSIEESRNRLPTSRPDAARIRYAPTKEVLLRTTKPKRTTFKSVSDDSDDNDVSSRDLRKSIAPPLPHEEISIEVFERERRNRENILAKSYSFVSNNSIQHGLKKYIKRRRHLDKKINELKEIYDKNQRSKVNITTYNGDNINSTIDFESEDFKNKKANIEETKDFIEKQSKPEPRAQVKTDEDKVRYSQGDVTKDQQASQNNKTESKKQKKIKKRESKKAPKRHHTKKSNTYSREAMKTPLRLFTLTSFKIPIFIDLLQMGKENKIPSDTMPQETKEVDIKEILIKKNTTAGVTDEDARGKLNVYVVVTPSIRKDRKVL